MASSVAARSGYTYKFSPHSSHSILLGSLPAEGQGKRVLDVGCAGGYLAEILAQRGYEVVGIERAGGHGDSFPETVELIEGDLDRGLPQLHGKFSYVICGDILEHLRDPAIILNQLGKVLEPDGVVLASLPNSGNLYFRLTILMGRFPREDRGLFDRTHLHFCMWKDWRELFEASGFSIADRKTTSVPVGLALPRWDGTALVRALEAIAYAAGRLRPALFAYQFVVTARRRNF